MPGGWNCLHAALPATSRALNDIAPTSGGGLAGAEITRS
ncbi:MAG: hypothetical protein JWM75_1024 [Sphingomonas bacterium]|nr:hypothetical protein [Sphingomonas bacterium]